QVVIARGRRISRPAANERQIAGNREGLVSELPGARLVLPAQPLPNDRLPAGPRLAAGGSVVLRVVGEEVADLVRRVARPCANVPQHPRLDVIHVHGGSLLRPSPHIMPYLGWRTIGPTFDQWRPR